MTPNDRWLTDADYRRGYNAYCAGLTDDISETQAWHDGYAQALQDSTKGEGDSYHG